MGITRLLTKKRFAQELSTQEIREFVAGVTSGEFADYQISAMLMAICINGMSKRETLDLTMEMARSGDTLDLSQIDGVKADKHSTGGVGDTTSLVLTPLVAACGVKMAKMSGRGLGFTGGTLDKLESVPGLSVDMDSDRFTETVNRVGCAIIGQTKSLAPADKVLYALRDVTATVDCLPLVVSSILSKKIAAGADVIMLDVKTGSGAIMDTYEKSMELAREMVAIGSLTGRRFAALVTDMNQPLGNCVGNALEVREAIDILAGRVEGDLKTVSLELGARILKLCGKARSLGEGLQMLAEKLSSGEGLKKLGEMFASQGGDGRVVYDTSLLPDAPCVESVKSPKCGYISKVNTGDIGNAAKALGAGRERKEQKIDLSVGLIMKKRIGDFVNAGDVICEMHISGNSDAARARALVEGAIELSDKPVMPPKLIYGEVE